MLAHSRRYDHFETGVACGPGDGQAVRAEIPVFGHEKEELRARGRFRYGRDKGKATIQRNWAGHSIGAEVGRQPCFGTGVSLMHLPGYRLQSS